MKAWIIIILLTVLSWSCRDGLTGRNLHTWVLLLEKEGRYDAVLVMGSSGEARNTGLMVIQLPYSYLANRFSQEGVLSMRSDRELRQIMDDLLGVRPDQVSFVDPIRSGSFIRILKRLEGFDGPVHLEYGRTSAVFWRLLASQAHVLAGDDVFPHVAGLADPDGVSHAKLHEALKLIASYGGKVTVIEAAAVEGAPGSIEQAFVREQVRQAVALLR